MVHVAQNILLRQDRGSGGYFADNRNPLGFIRLEDIARYIAGE